MSSKLLDRAALSPFPLGAISYWQGQTELDCDIEAWCPDGMSIRCGEQSVLWNVKAQRETDEAELFGGTVNGQTWWALNRGDSIELQVGGWRHVLQRAAPSARANGEGDHALAPMHGVVVALSVKPGDEVAEGDTLVILEAMKMENQVCAPRAGKISQLLCQIGASVVLGQVLVELEPAGGENPINSS